MFLGHTINPIARCDCWRLKREIWREGPEHGQVNSTLVNLPSTRALLKHFTPANLQILLQGRMPKQLQRDRRWDTSEPAIHNFFSQTPDSPAAAASNMMLTCSPHRLRSLGSPSPEPCTEGQYSWHSGSFSHAACAAETRLATIVPDTLPADLRELMKYIQTKGDFDSLSDSMKKHFRDYIASLQQTTTRLMECMASIKATMSDTTQKIQSMDSQLASAPSQLAKMQLHLEDIEDPSLKNTRIRGLPEATTAADLHVAVLGH